VRRDFPKAQADQSEECSGALADDWPEVEGTPKTKGKERKEKYGLKELPWVKQVGENRLGKEEVEQGQGGEQEQQREQREQATIPLRVIYLFSGAGRKGSFGECLRKEARKRTLPLVVSEMDVANARRRHNFLQPAVRRKILKLIEDGGADAIVASPPCATFSRARWANRRGPKPLRSSKFLRGFLRMREGDRKKTEEANLLVDFTLTALRAMLQKGGFILLEHPEDLGRSPEGGVPGSIWRWDQTASLANQAGVIWGAFFQNSFGAPYLKPTRLLGNFPGLGDLLFDGPPSFDERDWYLGPLPPKREATTSLIGKEGEKFKTEAAAAWPALLCSKLASLLLDGLVSSTPAPGKTLAKGDEAGVK